jgi:hypothetical protein
MDKLVKSFMAQAIAQHMDFGNCPFAEEGWSVSYQKEKLSQLITGNLYQDLMANKILQYWIGKVKSILIRQVKLTGLSSKPP